MNILHGYLRLYQGLMSRLRNIWFRLLGVKFSGYVWMRSVSIPRQWKCITIEEDVSLDDGVVLLCSGIDKIDKLIIHKNTYINRYTIITAFEHVEIGKSCMIGPHCYITDGNHGIKSKTSFMNQAMEIKPVILEDEVWLGAGVTVLPGVHLGKGCVIGAGAVVTKDIPAYSIAVGIPANIIDIR